MINKMLFEVECREEDTARALQHTIHHYTWPMINKTVNALLPEAGKGQHIIIDKIELQLGEFSLFDLEGNCFAVAFENNLRESLLGWKSKYQDNKTGEGHSKKANWEIMETFLLYGDLPWWIDKKEGVDAEGILNSIVYSNPARLESFLANQKGNVVRARLWTLLSNRGRDRFSKWFNITQNRYGIINASSHDLFADLQIAFKQNLRTQKTELQKMVQDISKKSGSQLSSKLIEKRLPRLVKKMEEIGVIKTDTLKQRQVAATIEILLRKAGLFNEAILRTLIKNWRLQQRRRKELMRELLKADRLFEFPLIKLIIEHPTAFEKKGLKGSATLITAWARTANIVVKQLRTLKPREQMQYYDLMSHGAIAGADKKLIQKLIKSLPVVSLQLLGALASLKDELLQNLLLEDENAELLPMSERQFIVENAGACLIAAYLPALFKKLGYVENNRFKTKTHAIRAVYLIHYMVHGKTRAPEYSLQLNKILCAWNLYAPLTARKRWNKTELQEADELLRSIILNWSALKSTSIESLRANFLQRKGILTENEQYWTLKVEDKSIDVLLDSISWPFGLVKLPWMKKPLQVEW